MSLSPDSSLVRRSIDLKYANRQRSASIKWILINSAIFLIFSMDLWHKCCPGRAGALHYVEGALAAGAAAAALQHALRLAGRPRAAPRPLSRDQRRLLGLAREPLDSSFCAAEEERPACGAPPPEEPASLSPARSWRAPASPGSSPRAASPAPDAPERAPRDLFIADADQLERYLSSVSSASDSAAGSPPPAGARSPAPLYQVSAARAAGHAPGEARAAHGAAPPPWRRLHLDPARLAHFNLNLRRWLHETILERLVREMDECDGELARAGLEARVGAASAARLAALGAGAGGAAARVRALLPFLRPFADQAYVARRVRELARGGCLAAYRWDAGAGADEARPSDAELVLHVFAAYLEGVLPGGGFAAAHLSAAPAPPPRAPAALVLHRAARRPPHYAVVVGAEVVEPAPGRDNLLHALLLFVAAAARRDPPALRRLHLGPAGLNLLWVLDR